MSRTILRLSQISERTGVPVATLRYWRHIGEGPPTFRLGKHVASLRKTSTRGSRSRRPQAPREGSRRRRRCDPRTRSGHRLLPDHCIRSSSSSNSAVSVRLSTGGRRG